MRFDVITLFPELVSDVTRFGVTGRASEQQKLELVTWNPRDYTSDVHRTVDDRPYGGGPGMVMKYEPLRDAIVAAKAENPGPVIYLSPQGRVLDQSAVTGFGQQQGLILLAGRYEGIDERIIEDLVDEEWSIGDYVLSGGELAAMVVIDTIARTIPGVLGHEDSADQDSFAQGLLDCPHYTRPEEINGKRVPEVLLSGDHERIRAWREQQALIRTFLRRPELLEDLELTSEQKAILNELDSEEDWQS